MPPQVSSISNDPSQPFALKPHKSAVIQAWVHSIELNKRPLSPSPPLKRKRDSSPAPRQVLLPRSPNMSRAEPRTPSPRKSARVLQRNAKATNDESSAVQNLPTSSPNRTPRPTFQRPRPEPLLSLVSDNSRGKHVLSKQHPILAVHDPYTSTLQDDDFEPQESSPDKESTASRSSRVSTSTRRSKSPVKRMADLQLSAKPILPYGLDEYSKPLPSSVQHLYKKLRRIAEGRKVVPRCVKKALKLKMGARDHRPLKHNFYESKQTECQRRPATPAACRRELSTIVETCSVARLWTSHSVNEASWNALVHCPLLKLALYPPVDEPIESDVDSGSDSDSDSDSDLDNDPAEGTSQKPLDPYGIAANSPVTFWDITTARPREDCVPRNVHGDMLESKLVDFCLAVSDSDMLDATLRTIQTASSTGRKGPSSINHTDYSVLTRRPISVSIETKMSGGSSETALSQLSAWAACHFERLSALRRFKTEMQGQVTENKSPVSIALPLLAVIGTSWKLYFAVDGESEIAIVHTITLGDMQQLVGCYQVVAALRELAQWSETTFREWFLENAVL